jgi:ribosomal subunit interface protein
MQLSLTFKDLEKKKTKQGQKNSQKKSLNKKEQEIIETKLKKIESFLPAHAKKSARMEVILGESRAKSLGKNFRVEINLSLPEKILVANFRSKSLHAAVDGAESRMIRQIRKYKTQHHIDKKMDGKSLKKLRSIFRSNEDAERSED